MRSSPANLTQPVFTNLSPDLRYQLLCRWRRRDWLITTSCVITALGLLAPVAVPQLNTAAQEKIARLLSHQRLSQGNVATLSSDFAAPIQEGEILAGHQVTSGFGHRSTATLPAGASADHQGVDLATPIGTNLFAPGETGTTVKVRCWRDLQINGQGGGGLVAEIEAESFPKWRFQALHLDACTTGIHAAGTVIATTGASGIGAAHLDWRQRDRTTGKHQHPQQQYLLWALTGQPPIALLSDIDILRNAIVSQESAGKATIINQDSGALGLGQVMPENLAPVDENGQEILNSGWDFAALGKDITPAEFLASPDKQTKIINHQLANIQKRQLAAGHSKDEAIRRTAAEWYSGDANKVDDTKPQRWKGVGTQYPSIQEYSNTVLSRVHDLQRQRLSEKN